MDKKDPTVSELIMLDLPWFNAEEGNKRLGEMGVLEQICHLRPTNPPWEGTEDIPFSLISKFVRSYSGRYDH